MYTFTQRLKIITYVLMGLGLIGLTIGFLSAPSTVAEAQAMVADAHGGHGGGHGDEHATDHSDAEAHAAMIHSTYDDDHGHADDHAGDHAKDSKITWEAPQTKRRLV